MKYVHLLFIILINSMNSNALPEGFGANFWHSMSCVKEKIPTLKKNKEWQTFKAIYDYHVINNQLDYVEHRIPKIIHQIWLGSPLPEKYKKLQKTWLEMHPDWSYKLWTDKDIEDLDLINKKQYDLTKNFGAKSDIARYEILYRFGGLYVDTDFECIKSFDIFHHCFDFYTGMAFGPACFAFNALIGSVPGHPILKTCIETLDTTQKLKENPLYNIMATSGPGHFTRALKKHVLNCSDVCVAFPVGYFYAWPSNKKANTPALIHKWIRPETYAIHHWHFSWKNKKRHLEGLEL